MATLAAATIVLTVVASCHALADVT